MKNKQERERKLNDEKAFEEFTSKTVKVCELTELRNDLGCRCCFSCCCFSTNIVAVVVATSYIKIRIESCIQKQKKSQRNWLNSMLLTVILYLNIENGLASRFSYFKKKNQHKIEMHLFQTKKIKSSVKVVNQKWTHVQTEIKNKLKKIHKCNNNNKENNH